MTEADPAALRAQSLCEVCEGPIGTREDSLPDTPVEFRDSAFCWKHKGGAHVVVTMTAPKYRAAIRSAVESERARAEEAEKARDEALAGLKTCAPTVCGTNALFPPTRMGCGQPIGLETHVFRCADCCTVFHRDCLKNHCADDLAALREEKARLATEHGKVFEALASTMARAEEAEKALAEERAAFDAAMHPPGVPGKMRETFIALRNEARRLILGMRPEYCRAMCPGHWNGDTWVASIHEATCIEARDWLASGSGPAAPPLPSAQQQELSGAPAARPGRKPRGARFTVLADEDNPEFALEGTHDWIILDVTPAQAKQVYEKVVQMYECTKEEFVDADSLICVYLEVEPHRHYSFQDPGGPRVYSPSLLRDDIDPVPLGNAADRPPPALSPSASAEKQEGDKPKDGDLVVDSKTAEVRSG